MSGSYYGEARVVNSALTGGQYSPQALTLVLTVGQLDANGPYDTLLSRRFEIPRGLRLLQSQRRGSGTRMEVKFMSQSGNSNGAQTVETLLVRARTQIVKYLPRHLDADKMIYVAIETVRADSFLRQCDSLSIV